MYRDCSIVKTGFREWGLGYLAKNLSAKERVKYLLYE